MGVPTHGLAWWLLYPLQVGRVATEGVMLIARGPCNRPTSVQADARRIQCNYSVCSFCHDSTVVWRKAVL